MWSFLSWNNAFTIQNSDVEKGGGEELDTDVGPEFVAKLIQSTYTLSSIIAQIYFLYMHLFSMAVPRYMFKSLVDFLKTYFTE